MPYDLCMKFLKNINLKPKPENHHGKKFPITHIYGFRRWEDSPGIDDLNQE